MERTPGIVWIGMVVFLIAANGCGDGASNAPTASISVGQQTAASSSAKPAVGETPVSTVAAFLEAVRSGNREAAQQLLTPLAVRKTKEHNLNFSPPGSETATFQIGTVNTTGQGAAQVASVWTDLDQSGNPRPERITWILKQSGDLWRISGMAAEVGSDQPPIVIDFEQPDELVRRQQVAAEPAQPAQASLPDRQATRPEDPFRQSTPR